MTDELPCPSLPRRDFILLPLISFLTIILMAGSAEVISRRIWTEKSRDDCAYIDPVSGFRHKPNCSMALKNIEGPWVNYQTNGCGYRSTAACGPKPKGTLRVVLMGSSVAYGLDVPYEELFANRVGPELNRIFGHPVEFQNLGGVDPYWEKSDLVLKEMLALNPDAVIYAVIPFDLNRTDRLQPAQSSAPPAPTLPRKSFWTLADLRAAGRDSRMLFLAQHFLLQNGDFLVRTFQNFASPLDVSRQPTPPLVEDRIERLDKQVGKLADRAHTAGIPCFMLALPNNVQAALISRNLQVPGMDALTFVRRMRRIADQHGMAYIDVVPEIQKTPTAEHLYYPVDGHPTGAAHAMLAKVVADYFRNANGLADAKARTRME